MTPNVTKTEPIALGALATLGVKAAMGLVLALGFQLSSELALAIGGVVDFVVLAVVVVKTRSVVWAPASVQTYDTVEPQDAFH